ncbi:MAG: hypothetical protein JSU95_19365 [Betaproteobacteria bacterium]|nr:MAG: hypothetical protein JSU95_19365 [Betaproteobacteria bacterium]
MISGTALASEDPENTSLRSEAATQLEMAITAVEEAARRKALWIPAEEALQKAKAAFDRGEFEHAIKLARDARQFAELGIKQLETPPYRHF